MDSGTPENEKDATTEKETVAQDKEASPVTNGESDPKSEPEKENGEASAAPESETKKPKKEKVLYTSPVITFLSD